jgi:pimeloyl-ACP methyl ester carboxylesterase
MTNNIKRAFKSEPKRHIHRLFLFFVALIAFASAPSSRFEVAAVPGDNNVSRADKGAVGESRFATLDGARIHYVNYGKGSEALILIHGWTMNVDNWREQVAEFAKRNRVIAIDLPGHGQSDKPQLAYSMDHFARAVDAVMRDAKVERAVLVGHSMGTPVARQFYRKYPKKTLAIVVVDGPLRPFADKATMDRMLEGFRSPNYKEAVGQMLAALMGPNLSAEAQQRIKGSAGNTLQHVAVGAMEGMADASIWGEDKINVPVLAIMAKGPLFPANIEELYSTLVPIRQFHIWEGVGHFIMMEKPAQFNEAVLAFLDKNKLLGKSKS